MYPQINIKHNIGNTIDIPNQLDFKVSTYISSDILAGVTALPVDNAGDFTAGAIQVLVGSVGSENSEIVASSSHTGQSIVTAATLLAHNRGDIVSEIKYDQASLWSSATIDGTYLEVETKKFFTTQLNTVFYHAAGTAGTYYKVQWKNSVTLAVSSFSAPMSVTAYPTNSAATLIYPVLKAMGIQTNDTRITIEFCLSALDDARKFTEGKLFGIRHSWQQKFEFPIQVLAGTNFVDLPADIDFTDTDRSVLAARFLIGNVMTPYNLRYIDKRSYNQIAIGAQGGFNQEVVAISGNEITLDSAGDFPNSASGVAYVATNAYNQQIMQIAYTAVNFATNKLTGVTGVTREIPIGAKVWSRPTISQPIYYTVYDDKLYFDRIIPNSMQGNNLYIDYYRRIEEVTDLYQVLSEHYREIYKWYLRYAIKYRKDVDLPANDPDLKKFEDLVQALVNNLYTGQDTTIITN